MASKASGSKVPCRYGAACDTTDCSYTHPGSGAGSGPSGVSPASSSGKKSAACKTVCGSPRSTDEAAADLFAGLLPPGASATKPKKRPAAAKKKLKQQQQLEPKADDETRKKEEDAKRKAEEEERKRKAALQQSTDPGIPRCPIQLHDHYISLLCQYAPTKVCLSLSLSVSLSLFLFLLLLLLLLLFLLLLCLSVCLSVVTST